MTETTDIAALRAKVEKSYSKETLRRLATTAIDQLEAERQRADRYRDCIRVLADHLSVNALPQEVIEAVAALKTDIESYISINGELATEVEALKGDQVPVAWVSASDAKAISKYSNKNNLCYESCLWFMKRFDSDMPLYDRPQKPAVHPDTLRMDWLVSQHVEVRTPMPYGSHMRFVAQCDSDDCEEYHTTLREQIDAAIEAAGGIVKVTDKCHPSLMESVTVPHNVIGSYEDASGGRSDIVTLSDKREMKDMSGIVKDGE